MKRLIIILPYFGKFPNYFSFWLQSVKNNSTIDWIIFTDNELKKIPENLKVINISFNNFSQLFRDYFPFEIKLNRPYKLCDFKIVYGLVLYDYVKDYDFWGFCDCDLIWGNIRNFISEEMLDKYNHLFGLGPFQLQRVDDPEYVNILKNTKALGKYDYKHVYSNEEGFVIDELPYGLPYQYYIQNRKFYYNEFSVEGRPYDSPTPDYFHFVDGYNSKNELGKAYKKTMFYKFKDQVDFWGRSFDKKKSLERNNLYRYSNGSIERIYIQDGILCKKELMYVHFRKRTFKICTHNVDKYFIIPNKFVEYKDNPSRYYMWRNGHKREFSSLRSEFNSQKDRMKSIYSKLKKSIQNCIDSNKQ